MDSELNQPESEDKKGKKPYQSPRILIHKELEGIAAYCDSAHGGASPCRAANPECYDLTS